MFLLFQVVKMFVISSSLALVSAPLLVECWSFTSNKRATKIMFPMISPALMSLCLCVFVVQPSAEDVSSSALLLDSSQPLSGTQKEQQRHSTVSLLRSCLQFPESESELQDIFSLIHELNSQEKDTEESNGWPSFYESAATHCSLCQYPLFKGDQRWEEPDRMGNGCNRREIYMLCCCFVLFSSVAGLEECWLLTDRSIHPVTLQLKVCTNLQCLVIHSFTDLHPGKHTHTHNVLNIL